MKTYRIFKRIRKNEYKALGEGIYQLIIFNKGKIFQTIKIKQMSPFLKEDSLFK
jgi:hypothetical protein